MKSIKERIGVPRNMGFFYTLKAFLFNLINHFLFFRVLIAFEGGLPGMATEFHSFDKDLIFRHVDEPSLCTFARNTDLELGNNFLQKAESQGGKCFAFQHGEDLASYGWYSTEPTDVYPGLYVSFPEGYLYAYKFFTLPLFRGQGLYPRNIVNTMLRSEYSNLRLFLFVEHINVPSLKSCRKLGLSPIGNVYLIRIFGRYFIRNDSAFDASGIKILCTST